MSRSHTQLTDELVDYIRSVSLREPHILRRLREQTAGMPESDMQVAPEQGQFMGLLACLIGARKALEIGVYTGYSSLCVALTLPEDGRLVACDVNSEWTSIGRSFWQEAGVASKIDLRLGPAVDTLNQLIGEGEAGSFDFTFIDADKRTYDAYYELSLELSRPGGLILIDNVLRGGRVIDPNIADADTIAIRDLNRKLYGDRRIDLAMVPIADGLTVVRKK